MLNKNSLILYVFKSIQKINITNFTQPVLRINNRLIFRHRRIVCNVYYSRKKYSRNVRIDVLVLSYHTFSSIIVIYAISHHCIYNS